MWLEQDHGRSRVHHCCPSGCNTAPAPRGRPASSTPLPICSVVADTPRVRVRAVATHPWVEDTSQKLERNTSENPGKKPSWPTLRPFVRAVRRLNTQELSDSFLNTNEDFDFDEDLNKQILLRHLLHTLEERMLMKDDPLLGERR